MERLTFTLRIPQDLRDVIKSDAAKVGVSVNERILDVLTEKYKHGTELERRMAELEREVTRLKAS